MFDDETLSQIFNKTDGHCQYCGKKLAWANYGNPKGRGGWEVDHSIPVSRGGTDHLNNLYPACVECNKNKGNLTGRQYKGTFDDSAGRSNGNSWAPLVILGGLLLLGFLMGKREESASTSFKNEV